MSQKIWRDFRFELGAPILTDAGWVVHLSGQRQWTIGPTCTEFDARARLERLFQRWQVEAAKRGGWAWKACTWRWVVTLPVGTACAGLALNHAPAAHHELGPPPAHSAPSPSVPRAPRRSRRLH